VDYKLELVVVPVSDLDRAKAFYLEQCGFDLIVDHTAGDFRIVQLNPHGSSCAIAMMKTSPMAPGSLHGLHLVVSDVAAAHAELVGRGVAVSEPYHYDVAGQSTPGIDPKHGDYSTFMNLRDPDGNTWLIQEVGYPAAAG
jgi:predicted enzyme related to lactoylglutathione lyase